MVSPAEILVLNIGTLPPHWVQSMEIAGRKANQLKIPVILDRVETGVTWAPPPLWAAQSRP
ncbi:4-methyl-5-beta-hydroxyethylthiazole kinase [Desulfarculales bacterium]